MLTRLALTRGRALLDDAAGPREKGRGQVEPEGPGGPEIDHELQLGGLLDRQVAGSCRLGENGRRSGEDCRSGGAEERSAGDQIFQEPIQSMSLAPDGFMPCLVETTSTGSMVTKS